VGEALPERARGKPVEIWCPDEARVGQQGTLTRIWARRGSRPRAPRDRRSSWACLFGAVCPERAIGAGLVLPDATTEAIGLHLAEIGRHVAPGARARRDRARWGGMARHPGPAHAREPHPPAAAALQPGAEPGRERLGGHLRQNQLSLRGWPDDAAIVETCCTAWNALMREPDRIASITRRDWARTVGN
jgi:hypothetical protein